MKVATPLTIALFAIAPCTYLSAEQTAVIINLTEQTAYLLVDGRVAFVSPVASGKEGWGTPTGNFRVLSKDLNHQSGNFGLISDCYGRIINPNATPGKREDPDLRQCFNSQGERTLVQVPWALIKGSLMCKTRARPIRNA